ncbi:hypothetical protein EV363DRAFT_1413877 [Boletus edulis]|nr:hypothetical protein EV363DRAFT_1413877 [Boletus edulis]
MSEEEGKLSELNEAQIALLSPDEPARADQWETEGQCPTEMMMEKGQDSLLYDAALVLLRHLPLWTPDTPTLDSLLLQALSRRGPAGRPAPTANPENTIFSETGGIQGNALKEGTTIVIFPRLSRGKPWIPNHRRLAAFHDHQHLVT